jgi:hypothetical protein
MLHESQGAGPSAPRIAEETFSGFSKNLELRTSNRIAQNGRDGLRAVRLFFIFFVCQGKMGQNRARPAFQLN